MNLGVFHLEKKVRKLRCEFPGISPWEKVVPFCCKFRLCRGARCLKGHQNGGRVDINVNEPLAADEEEMLIDSDDEEEICVIAATFIFMRQDLNRNYGFCDVIVPTYSIDELKSHFRMKTCTLDILCREVAATGEIPLGNRFGRPPIPVQCPRLVFRHH